ncbi:MAG: helix-hairpin-helix domain-containing protein [Ardenticatenaceae bacterium]|nr:helix-hairpin-helix domain-containing protein [Ardenticatenaceae bacterium]
MEIGVSRPGSVGKAADISPKEKKAKAKEEAPKAEEAPAPAVEAAVEETVAEPVLEEVAAEAEAPVEAPPAPAKEAKPKAAKKSKKDNLKKLEGVGPKIASVLADAGIETFAQVASASVEELDKIVRQDAGISIANPETWPEQAALAAEGKWDELKEMQDGLKGGRRS